MTFDDLISCEDPSTLAKLSDEKLREILSDALHNRPPIEEAWINAKIQAKKKPLAKKSTTRKTQVKNKEDKHKDALISQILGGGNLDALTKALGGKK